MPWADIIVRGAGGDNAGHIIVNNGKENVFHLMPSGIIGDKEGKMTIIGPGTVIYPKSLLDEMVSLMRQGLSHSHLKVSSRAKLILPTHIFEDRAKELDSGDAKIGTTGKGIGPAYADHYARIGLTMNDLLNEEIFRKKLKRHLKAKKHLLDYPADKAKEIMCSDHLMAGIFYHPDKLFNFEQIVYQYVHVFGKIFQRYIHDTDVIMRKSLKAGKKIILEGAQGDLLSVDYGTYPYVTSSDASLEGLAKGCGLRTENIDLDLGIIKGFYMTRVGSGPFITEMGGIRSAEHCARCANKKEDEKSFSLLNINCVDPFILGWSVRQRGNEYGATTGRPRRTGYLDLVLLYQSFKRCSEKTRLVLTKLDVLTGMSTIKICIHYMYMGPRYFDGQFEYLKGSIVTDPPMDSEFLSHCSPVYMEFSGWTEDISKMKNYNDLPLNLRKIINFITDFIGTNNLPAIISVGPDREETIML